MPMFDYIFINEFKNEFEILILSMYFNVFKNNSYKRF